MTRLEDWRNEIEMLNDRELGNQLTNIEYAGTYLKMLQNEALARILVRLK